MSTHWFDEAMNLPGATLDNAVDPDVIGAYGLEPDHEAAGEHDYRPEQATPLRCAVCDHGSSTHTGGYGQCWQHPCGCPKYRDPESIPARFDERYDPSPEPINRSIQ